MNAFGEAACVISSAGHFVPAGVTDAEKDRANRIQAAADVILAAMNDNVLDAWDKAPKEVVADLVARAMCAQFENDATIIAGLEARIENAAAVLREERAPKGSATCAAHIARLIDLMRAEPRVADFVSDAVVHLAEQVEQWSEGNRVVQTSKGWVAGMYWQQAARACLALMPRRAKYETMEPAQ
jgi:hypothetical protein